MVIGIPKEIKDNENRVSIIPFGVEELIKKGHSVLVEKDAGIGSGITDSDYSSVGATIYDSPADIFAESDMIVKVKEPLSSEIPMIKEGQIVFTYFHFAASESLTRGIIDSRCIAIAYETVELDSGKLPLLVPMSEIAGRMATQNGAKCLEASMGGAGKLLSGVPGVEPATVMIIGGGIVGMNAAKIASGLGAKVYILDINQDQLKYIDDVMASNVFTIYSNRHNILELLPKTDLLIGAVLVVGAKAPNLITRDMLSLMKKGSVIVDVAVDQGGCVETCKPTTHANPTYDVDGIVHYCVANMPGAVPYTSTVALSNATFPYVKLIADRGVEGALAKRPELQKGLNIMNGNVVHSAVAETFGLEYIDHNGTSL